MLRSKNNLSLSTFAAVFALLVGIAFDVSADQVSISYVDANSQAQTLTVDANSSTADLALAADLLNEFGVSISHDPNNGTGSLADIAKAMATAAPVFAGDIAVALSELSPANKQAIVAAINSVIGVNSVAVLAAVHFGDGSNLGPQSTSLPQIETVSSSN